MAYLAIDLSGKEYIFQNKPQRLTNSWSSFDFQFVQVPKGTIILLTGKRITWNDEPIELTVTNYDQFYQFVCSCSGCSVDELYTRTRKREVVWARQIIVAYRKIYLGLTMVMAGAEFGLDHATVLHSIRNMTQLSEDALYYSIFKKVFEQYPDLLTYEKRDYLPNHDRS